VIRTHDRLIRPDAGARCCGSDVTADAARGAAAAIRDDVIFAQVKPTG
jgi:hypothetical protein